MSKPRAVVRLLATLLLVVAGSAVVGRASSLGGSSNTLGAAVAATPRCGTAGISMVEVGGANISSLSLGNIPATCAGATLTATLNNNGGTTRTVTGTVPAGGGTMSLTITPTVPLTVAAQVDIVMTGP